MTDQEVPTWDPNNLPQSWDEAFDRYAKIRRTGGHIGFHDTITNKHYRYAINENCCDIIYYKYNNFWYGSFCDHNVHLKYTYINDELVMLDYNDWKHIGPIPALIAKYHGKNSDEYIQELQESIHYSTKSARK